LKRPNKLSVYHQTSKNNLRPCICVIRIAVSMQKMKNLAHINVTVSLSHIIRQNSLNESWWQAKAWIMLIVGAVEVKALARAGFNL